MSQETTIVKKPNLLERILSWIVTLLIPTALVLTAIRLLMFPTFLRIEYNTPNFPPDRYGFIKEERLYWSGITLEYLLNDADISFLEDLRFEDGAEVYNARELKHMVDVKVALNTTLWVWRISIGILLGLGLWAWFGGWWDPFRLGMRRGGWLTVILIGTMIFIVIISFGVFFVAFHNVFFESGTWVFQFSDTLIRLFPERFWRDIFIYVGALSMAGGLALALGLRSQE